MLENIHSSYNLITVKNNKEFFNSFFHFTQGNTNYAVFQVIYIIDNCTYSLCLFSFILFMISLTLHYAYPLEIGKELTISHASPK